MYHPFSIFVCLLKTVLLTRCKPCLLPLTQQATGQEGHWNNISGDWIGAAINKSTCLVWHTIVDLCKIHTVKCILDFSTVWPVQFWCTIKLTKTNISHVQEYEIVFSHFLFLPVTKINTSLEIMAGRGLKTKDWETLSKYVLNLCNLSWHSWHWWLDT